MFWDNFVKLCDEKGEKPNPVAKKLSIASGTITAWKNGGVPSGKSLQKIADYFGVSVDYLLGKTDEPSPTKATIIELPNALSEQEQDLIDAYRAHPEMQAAVDRLLGIEKITVYVAAQDETKFDGNIEITRNKWEQIKNAPDETEPLL